MGLLNFGEDRVWCSTDDSMQLLPYAILLTFVKMCNFSENLLAVLFLAFYVLRGHIAK